MSGPPDRASGFGAALASVRGLPPPGTPAASTLAPPAPVAPVPPPPPVKKKWHKKTAKALTSLLFLLGDEAANLALRKRGKEVEETEKDDEERLEIESELEEQMPIWFPDTDVPHWGQALILFGGCMGEKMILAKDIKKPPALPAQATAPAPGAHRVGPATSPVTVAAPTSTPTQEAGPATPGGGTVDA